jgi:hypothetical protein
MAYVKLFGSILASTIWRESNETRLVWITMLAMADRDGIVSASVPGLAHMAQVTVPECEAALECLSSEDPYSRTKDHGGRRIAPTEGGWLILNYEHYRDMASAEDKRQKRKYKRDKLKAETSREPHAPHGSSLNLTPSGSSDLIADEIPCSLPCTSVQPPLPSVPCPDQGESRRVVLSEEQGSEQGSAQPNLFALLSGTRIRDKVKNRRVVLSKIAAGLAADGMTAASFTRLLKVARQEANGNPDALLSHWISQGAWKEKLR